MSQTMGIDLSQFTSGYRRFCDYLLLCRPRTKRAAGLDVLTPSPHGPHGWTAYWPLWPSARQRGEDNARLSFPSKQPDASPQSRHTIHSPWTLGPQAASASTA